MKNIKKMLLTSVMLTSITVTTTCFANELQERQYLIQLLNQLNAMQPFILAAAKEQPKNKRIEFHYTRFRDDQGQLHNGLLEDVQAIKKGIEEKLNETPIEPRVVSPIAGDYLLSKGETH